jgi:hypothetical protein
MFSNTFQPLSGWSYVLPGFEKVLFSGCSSVEASNQNIVYLVVKASGSISVIFLLVGGDGFSFSKTAVHELVHAFDPASVLPPRLLTSILPVVPCAPLGMMVLLLFSNSIRGRRLSIQFRKSRICLFDGVWPIRSRRARQFGVLLWDLSATSSLLGSTNAMCLRCLCGRRSLASLCNLRNLLWLTKQTARSSDVILRSLPEQRLLSASVHFLTGVASWSFSPT